MFAVMHRDDLTAWIGLGIALLTFFGLVWRYIVRPIGKFTARLSRFMDQVEEHFFAKDGKPSTFDGIVAHVADHEVRITQNEHRITAIEAERPYPK